MYKLFLIALTSLFVNGCFLDNFGPPPKPSETDDAAQHYHDRSDDEGEGRGEAPRQ